MMSHVPLFVGIVVGLSVAVPIGPMGLLCVQRTLACGMRVGVCTGLGAATVNAIYGGMILLGLGRAGDLVAGGGRVLGFAGGLFLLWSAARTILRQREMVGRAQGGILSPARAYGSAVAFNATNPMSPVLMVALLSPVVAPGGSTTGEAALLLLGMFTGAAGWWVCLTGSVSLLRSRLSPAMLRAVNHVAGAVLTFYGAWALMRAAGM